MVAPEPHVPHKGLTCSPLPQATIHPLSASAPTTSATAAARVSGFLHSPGFCCMKHTPTLKGLAACCGVQPAIPGRPADQNANAAHWACRELKARQGAPVMLGSACPCLCSTAAWGTTHALTQCNWGRGHPLHMCTQSIQSNSPWQCFSHGVRPHRCSLPGRRPLAALDLDSPDLNKWDSWTAVENGRRTRVWKTWSNLLKVIQLASGRARNNFLGDSPVSLYWTKHHFHQNHSRPFYRFPYH